MRRFAGIALISDRIPDETTILAFRQLVEQNNLDEQIFEAVKAHLKANSIAMKKGTIKDATIVALFELSLSCASLTHLTLSSTNECISKIASC